MASRLSTSFIVLPRIWLRSGLVTSNQCHLFSHVSSKLTERHLLHSCIRYASSIKNEKLGTEIYIGPLSNRIRTVKLFSFASSFAGLATQPMLFQKVVEEGHNIGVVIFSGVIIQFFTFVTPVMFHYIGKRYVRKIYYNEDTDEYTALTYNFFATDKVLKFKRDDVVVPDIPGMFTSWIVKDVPLFVEASHFEDLDHYKKLMGFDKPLDFKLSEKPAKE